MPAIKINHLVLVSNEDQDHPASNLLKEEDYKRWTCSAGDTSQAIAVILQLEKSSKISRVDIGNGGSAFVEVLVGKISDKDSNYQVLLASSFMTPSESRAAGEITNYIVRTFGIEQLCKEVADGSWERVKIVCSQPYNHGAQYGLSFIKFYSPDETQKVKIESSTSVGTFTIKQEKDGYVLTPDSLDLQRNRTSVEQEMRQSSDEEGVTILEVKMALSRRQRKSVKDISDKVIPVTSAKIPDTGMFFVSDLNDQSGEKRKTPPNSDDTLGTKKARIKDEPSEFSFDRLMSGVVFALSGFLNPLRGELRERAIAMGAQYNPVWDSTCTHLICAFLNTPKFKQAESSNGIIVTKEWILDCHRQRKCIPWTDYSMRCGETSFNGAVEGEESLHKCDDPSEMAFRQLMSGVVFSLTGFHSPLRGELRERAVAMGAQYSPVWDSTCTHLICGILNTQKFNQAKSSNGKIVTKEWILDCHRHRKYFQMTDYEVING